jgi:hypothetical protein
MYPILYKVTILEAPKRAVWTVIHTLAGKRVSGQQEISGGSISAKSFLLRLRQEENAGKGKGCDIGYALATSSCEEANSVEACTVTALDATTAFAVPNPNCPSQSRRFFQVWLLCGLPR